VGSTVRRVWENGASEAVKIRNTCLRDVADRENELFDYVANSFILSYQTPIRDKQFFFFLKKSFNKSLKRGLFFVYLLLIINHITK